MSLKDDLRSDIDDIIFDSEDGVSEQVTYMPVTGEPSSFVMFIHRDNIEDEFYPHGETRKRTGTGVISRTNVNAPVKDDQLTDENDITYKVRHIISQNFAFTRVHLEETTRKTAGSIGSNE